jgi:hypothetical protein
MMAERGVTRRPEMDAQEWLSQAPKVGGALKKGNSVSVTTRGARSPVWSVTGSTQSFCWIFDERMRTREGKCSSP